MSVIERRGMRSLLVLLLFVGMFVIVHGVYDERFRALKDNVRVEYRFVPRTFYEEQLSNSHVTSIEKNMFENTSPWQQQNLGSSGLGGYSHGSGTGHSGTSTSGF